MITEYVRETGQSTYMLQDLFVSDFRKLLDACSTGDVTRSRFANFVGSVSVSDV